MASFTMGRYVPYNSFVHRMDPRLKIYSLIVLMVAIFVNYPTWTMTYTMLGILFLFTLILLWTSHMSLTSLLKSLSGLWFMVVFLLLIYILVPRYTEGNQDWYFTIGNFKIYYESLLEAGKVFFRLVIMLSLSLILTSTTKPLSLTDGLEWYLTPLRWLGVPTPILAMIISLALRFIPTILEDVERILKAQSSRGVDFKHGRIFAKFKAIISLIIPLFVSSFVRSDELANAMECRGYDPMTKRTKYRQLHFRWWDLLELVIVSFLVAGFFYISITGTDLYALLFGLTLK